MEHQVGRAARPVEGIFIKRGLLAAKSGRRANAVGCVDHGRRS